MKAAFADVMIGRLISRQFDNATENAFKFYQTCNNIDNKTLPTLSVIENFVHRRIQDETTVIQIHQNRPGGSNTARPTHVQTKYNQAKIHVQHSSTKCLYCNKPGHTVVVCRKFIALKLDDRIKAARSLKLCFKCANAVWSDCNCKITKTYPTTNYWRTPHKTKLTQSR